MQVVIEQSEWCHCRGRGTLINDCIVFYHTLNMKTICIFQCRDFTGIILLSIQTCPADLVVHPRYLQWSITICMYRIILYVRLEIASFVIITWPMARVWCAKTWCLKSPESHNSIYCWWTSQMASDIVFMFILCK